MELTNLSREEKKAYDLEQIDALVQKNQGMAKTSDILAMGIDYRRILQFLAAMPLLFFFRAGRAAQILIDFLQGF